MAMRSILNQTYRNWELLLVDDGSTDRSLSIAQGFRDPRIRIVSGGQRRGISARLNQLVDASRGKYFARMDGDDVAFPERMERQVSYLESHPQVDLLGASVVVFCDDGSVTGTLPVEQSHAAICARPWSGFYLPHPTWVGRRGWFVRHGYDEKADGAEDQHLLFRSYRTSRFACLPDVLLGYRENRRVLKRMLRRRYVFFKSLFSSAMAQEAYDVALKLFISQTAKATGDFLNLVVGMKGMRNRLVEIDAATREKWRETWKACTDAEVWAR